MKNYGGAFDIDSQSYFTREDLNMLQEAINDFNPNYTITALYLDENNVFDIEYTDAYDNEYKLEKEIKVDLRKVSLPKDLIKYALPIHEALNSELESHLNIGREDYIER